MGYNADPRWGSAGRMDRLAYLSALPEGPVPTIAAGPVNDIPTGEPAAFLKAIRDYSNEHVDREFMDDRKDLWNMHDQFMQNRPSHMYLKHPEGTTAHMMFYGWIQIIKQDLQCDDRACSAFIELMKLMPPDCPWGFHEANRILAHIFKDKNKPNKHPRGPREDWSRFLENACEEAQEAIMNHQTVKSLRLKNRAEWEGSWGAYATGPPDGPGASGDHDLNRGKGSGKGKNPPTLLAG